MRIIWQALAGALALHLAYIGIVFAESVHIPHLMIAITKMPLKSATRAIVAK